MDQTVLTASVPLELAEKVDEIATRLDRPRGWVVEQALAEWIEREALRRQWTLEGLADADAGRVLDDAAVLAWADSLGGDQEVPLPQPG